MIVLTHSRRTPIVSPRMRISFHISRGG